MKEGSNGDVSAEQAHGILPDWKSLDFYIVLLGLAFCRAWIVLCLSAAAVTTLVTNSNWAFLLAGSTAAAGVAVAARRAATQDRFEARMRV